MTELDTLSASFAWRARDLEWPVTTEVGRGLSGVVAATTRVMWLDPASGTLSYRGVPVESVAGRWSFEQVAFLLISGRSPGDDGAGFEAFRERLRSSRRLPPEVTALVRDLDPATHPTRLLRAGVSALGCWELGADDELSGDRHWRELRIVGQVAGLVAEVAAHRAGRARPTVDDRETLADGILGAVTGVAPDRADGDLLDLLWVLYAAHGLDAPTFTSMIVASCLADPYFNVVAGLSALCGPRQGGASEAVLDQLAAQPGPEHAVEWVRGVLSRGGRIAGFGHRVYRMPDPRVVILRRELARLARRRGRPEVFEAALALEHAATAELAPRGVHVNINFYAAPIFALLGAHPALVPCLFAVGRMAGLVALVREAIDDVRLIRPLSRYTGPPERRVGSASSR
ncbi:MAG: citrate/2-methylcitrate synthase [Thermoanaerobaculales bacterium]|jgi:citrate synthase|nr:citrate/2-methylcitrate synthase [Thermoanaerobaculales bacterium]